VIINPYRYGGGGPPPGDPYFTAGMLLNPRNYYRMMALTGPEIDQGFAGDDGGYSGSVVLGEPSLCGDSGDFSVGFTGPGSGAMTATSAFVLNSGGASFGISFLFNPANVSGLKGMVSMGTALPYIRLNGSAIDVLSSQTALLGTFSDPAVASTKSHLLVSFNPTGADYYFNGSASGGHSGGAFTSAATSIYVGNENLSFDNMDGLIDEVMYFDFAPTAGDAAALFAAVT
jgi:hypothetical protein